MRLVKCKACGHTISKAAKSCPSCGQPVKKTSVVTWIILIFLVFVAYGVVTENSPSKSGLITSASVSSDPKSIALSNTDFDFKWSKAGFGSIMEADFTLKNNSKYSFKDFTVKCTHYGPSGTAIDYSTETVYEIVPANLKKTFRDVNMGFIDSQTNSSSCVLSDLVLIP